MRIAFCRVWIRRVYLCLPLLTGLPVLAEGPAARNLQDRMGSHPGGSRKVIGLLNTNCSLCHGKPASRTDADQDVVSDIGNDHWILQDELLTWEKMDYHHQAFATLLTEQSQQIAKLLGVVDSEGNSIVHRDRRCLSCHSSMPVDQMALKGDLVQEETQRNPRYTIGVSCEACHGPAGKRADGAEGWGAAHSKPHDQDDPSTTWRALSPQTKFDEFGYWDVHSPRTQARICLSCHVGNAEQQKVITHEMYAAGHPPLPSFEQSQFIQQMPRHWRRLDEKNERVRNQYLKQLEQLHPGDKSIPVYDPEEVAVTKATMIAALVALEDSMQLTADLIEGSSTDTQWPEFANYACFACHHELQRDGWRKQHRITSTPGRPTLHEWPLTLSRVVAASLNNGDSSDLFIELNAVINALNARPYGDLQGLKKATTSLAKVAELHSRKLSSTPIHREQALQFLNQIAQAASTDLVDYDSARQFFWAYERTDAQLFSSNREGDNPLFEDVASVVMLRLNKNRESIAPVQMYVGAAPLQPKRPQFAVRFDNTLRTVSDYDPKAVHATFEKLRNRSLSDGRKK